MERVEESSGRENLPKGLRQNREEATGTRDGKKLWTGTRGKWRSEHEKSGRENLGYYSK